MFGCAPLTSHISGSTSGFIYTSFAVFFHLQHFYCCIALSTAVLLLYRHKRPLYGDYFSKYFVAVPLCRHTAEDVANAIFM